MATKKPTSTLAIAGTSTQIFDGIEAVKTAKAKLQHIADSVYKTPGVINYGEGKLDLKGDKKNFKLSDVVKAFASVMARIQAQEQAYKTLGITTHATVKIDGGTLEEWTADVKLTIDIMNNGQKLEKLNKLEAAFTDLMGKEEKAALLLQQLNEEIITE